MGYIMNYFLVTAVLPLFTISFQSSSKNKELLKRFYKEVYVNWDLKVADEMLSPEFVSHDWPENGHKGPQAFRDYYAVLRKAVPDATYEVKDLIADGDRVVVRWEMHGTHRGNFPGIDIVPSGQPITLKGVAIYRVANGKLMERWVVSDLYGLLKEARKSSRP